MKIFPTKKDPIPPTPNWMRGGLLLFIVLMAYTGYKNEKRYDEGDENAPSIKKYQAITAFGDVDGWRRTLNPSYGKSLNFEDLKKGDGDFAACGQKVVLKVDLAEENEPPLPNGVDIPPEAKFTIGKDEIVEALDRGVRGMRTGGVRRIWAGPRLVDPSEKDPDAAPYVFDLQLVALEPSLPKDQQVLQFARLMEGYGAPLHCGDNAVVQVRLYDAQEKLLYETPEDAPAKFVLGDGSLGHGIDRGMVNMLAHETRRFVVPKAYAPPAKSPVPFSKYAYHFIDVTRLEDGADNPTTPQEPDHEPEPDSQTPKRDQTLPHDGDDRQSGGDESVR